MAPLSARGAKRIVVIDWSMIGDLIMLSPCIRAIRAANPEAHLALLGQPNSIVTYKAHPAVNQLIPYDRSKGELYFPPFLAAVRELREGRFDTAYIFHNSIGSALMAAMGGVRQRIGYAHEGRDLLLTKRLKQPAERMHLMQVKAEMLRQAGIEVSDLREEVLIDEQRAQRWVKDHLDLKLGYSRPLIAVSLGSTMEQKRWSAESLNELLNLFPLSSADFVLIGAPSEKPLYEGVYSYSNSVTNLVGQTTIEELSWLIDRADMYIGADSGPMHIALGRSKAVLGLFGPSDPKRCGPFDYPNARVIRSERICSACEARLGKQMRQCLHTISPAEVYSAARELLAAVPLWKS
jgi:lipopolysaccharide heptosyltransferase II